ncbi:hypothetical protein LHP98_10360 [Rhodobacter sp. Har01]|uniref:hypothetical protein n=1 Tax=Rhodobacter sp. Har01 TaxID=2883999 RepID=UPI001D05DCE5|nr:hypothetical protein [Rhodobacter sp. Har01]MCB6178533.1 hypothetical protein [Rhodobacter sp. Har01]
MTRPHVPLALIGIVCGLPAVAQDRAAAYGQVLDRAMTEFRVFLTCTALEPSAQASVRDIWKKQVTETLAVLANNGVSPPNLVAFTASALPGSLTLPPDTPFSEVIAFCAEDPDWMQRLVRLEFTRLPQALAKAAP